MIDEQFAAATLEMDYVKYQRVCDARWVLLAPKINWNEMAQLQARGVDVHRMIRRTYDNVVRSGIIYC